MNEITDQARERGRGERTLQAGLSEVVGWKPDAIVSARLLVRYLSAQSQVNAARFHASVLRNAPDFAACGLMTAQFAAAHALLALAETSQVTADQAAAEIQEAWESGESAEWTAAHLGDKADAVADLADRIAQVPAAWQQAMFAAAACSDKPAESCSDAGCPVHGWETDPRDGDGDA